MEQDLKVRSPFLTFGGVEYFRACANSRTVLAKKSVQSATMRPAACTGVSFGGQYSPPRNKEVICRCATMQRFFRSLNLQPAEGNSYASGSLASVIIVTRVSTGGRGGVNVRLQPFIRFDEVIAQKLRAVHCNPGITLTQCNALRCGSHSNPSEQAFRESNGCVAPTLERFPTLMCRKEIVSKHHGEC